ncbi:MAG TPA: tetratricopeptide repeat protein [Candidatus Limnocylindrales bacterium]|nr:tetratricopeptide repeat protein [Candidatus Limnocylindrales bacterium]
MELVQAGVGAIVVDQAGDTRSMNAVTRLFEARWLPATVVAAVTLLTFLPSLGHGFVNWDDDENFLWNPHYRGLGWAQLRWMATAVQQGVYVPIAWLTLGLDHVLWGMNPAGYHLTSVVLHSTNAVLLYLVARRLLAAGLGTARDAEPSIRLGASVAALLFAVHPLRVESVVWITERRDVVVGLFTLLTVLAYLRAVRRGERGRLHAGWYGAALAGFALALLSKAIVVALPVALLALDVYPLRRAEAVSDLRPRRRRMLGLVLEKLPFLALAAAVSALTLAILSSRGLLASRDDLGIAQRLALSAHALVFYLEKTLVPWALSPLYTLFHPIVPASPRYLAPAVVIALLTAVVVAARGRWPAGLVTWVAYVALVLPVLGFFHSGPQAAADRYTYLAGMAWAVLGGAGVAWSCLAVQAGRAPARLGRLAVGAAVALIAGLAALTVLQVRVWHDSVSLWTHAAAVEPESDIPIFYLGWALTDARRFDEAGAHFTRALARVPDRLPELRAEILTQRGIVAQRARDPAGAERDFRAALALDPGHAVATIRLGGILLGRNDTAGADTILAPAATLVADGNQKTWELRRAIDELPPETPPATRGRLTFAFALHLQHRGALAEAEQQYRVALAFLPRATDAWNNLGVIYAATGRFEEALDAFVAALQVEPGHGDACRNAAHAAEAAHRRPPELDGCARPASR